MSRESGYYFVKIEPDLDWQVAEWSKSGDFWEFAGVEVRLPDTELHTIHPTRIPTPDEVVTGEEAQQKIIELTEDCHISYEGIDSYKFKQELTNFDITLKRKG